MINFNLNSKRKWTIKKQLYFNDHRDTKENKSVDRYIGNAKVDHLHSEKGSFINFNGIEVICFTISCKVLS